MGTYFQVSTESEIAAFKRKLNLLKERDSFERLLRCETACQNKCQMEAEGSSINPQGHMENLKVVMLLTLYMYM